MRRLFVLLVLLIEILSVNAQNTIRISIIDFYGNRTITTDQLRKTLGVSEGEINIDTVKREVYEARLKALPGVTQAHLNLVCCDQSTGGMILFAGVSENNDTIAYRPEPTDEFTLPFAILKLGRAFNDAMMQAIQHGNAGEESANGYALMNDSLSKDIQLQFIPVARDNYAMLKKILYESAFSEHRAFAAQIIAYSPDRKSVIKDLMYAVHDNNESVRNNATRALSLLAGYANEHPEAGLTIPAEPFIDMLNSHIWTDRNKGVMILRFLTEKRDPQILKQLKQKALPSLIEMAKWKSEGHAFAAYLILGRLAGEKDDDIFKAFSSTERNTELGKWIKKIRKGP